MDKPKQDSLKALTSTLEDRLGDVEYLDIGEGVERQLGVSKERLRTAAQKLVDEEGYYIHTLRIRRLNNYNKRITIKVLTKEPDYMVVLKNSDKIRSMNAWSEDKGQTFKTFDPNKIVPVQESKIKIVYSDDGGSDRDGMIEIRPGVKDLDLGDSKYAQVRIATNNGNYLKGMAVYSDDLPEGINIRFNTNKPKGTPPEKVFKSMKDKDDPFGSYIKRQRGALNIINEEGEWAKWSKTISSQFLSKQPKVLVKDRLSETYNNTLQEYEEISALTNPTVKRYLLEAFADGLSSKSRSLQAQGLPRTRTHVLIPYPELKPNEIYAPGYKNGEKVVLVRHPHGGIFEIPELIVNNSLSKAKKQIGNTTDAVGIHPSQAVKLSGADFDGDTVLVIPNHSGQVKTSRSLTGLKDFDPNIYKVDHETIKDHTKQIEMGKVSNLITDMTLKNAPQHDIAAAVRHSMVVIDSKKHKLDYKQSEIDNRIPQLRKKYQNYTDPISGKERTAASTLISRSKSKIVVENPKTGKKEIKYLVDSIDDARIISSGTAVENTYADYINKNKTLQNKIYKELYDIPRLKQDPVAKKLYSKEVKSLEAKLNKALLNAPKERAAQLQAASIFYDNYDKDKMDKDDIKALKRTATAQGRAMTGAKRQNIQITDKEWQAIQAGAISDTKLNKILRNTDMDRIRELATPKDNVKLNSARESRIKSMASRGYTYAEIAESIGVSVGLVAETLGA